MVKQRTKEEGQEQEEQEEQDRAARGEFSDASGWLGRRDIPDWSIVTTELSSSGIILSVLLR